MNLSLRQRLSMIVALAALTCAVALAAIVPLVRTGRTQRAERARDTVLREVERLRERGDDGSSFGPRRDRPRRLLGGYVDDTLRETGGRRGPGPVVRAALDVARRQPPDADGIAIGEAQLSEGLVVVGIGPMPQGGYAWAAARVPTPPGEPWVRFGIAGLVLASLLAAGAAVHTGVAFQRGAASLRASLAALGDDLGARVARPSMRELATVADGVAELAARLLRSRADQERLTRELAQRDRLASLGRVAAGVAHEVRNPLASIKLRVDLLRRTPETSAAVAEDLREVSDEVSRLDRLVNDLLVVAGRRTGPRSRHDVAALLARRAALMSAWAQERGVEIVVEGSGMADVDADALARAMDNLLRNAVEASPPGATVRARVGPDAGTTSLAIVVEDQGPGVAAARATELFEPFFTTKPEGTGLGLALSRAVAEAHGGTLLYRREGAHTRFVLTLQRAAA